MSMTLNMAIYCITLYRHCNPNPNPMYNHTAQININTCKSIFLYYFISAMKYQLLVFTNTSAYHKATINTNKIIFYCYHFKAL